LKRGKGRGGTSLSKVGRRTEDGGQEREKKEPARFGKKEKLKGKKVVSRGKLVHSAQGEPVRQKEKNLS